MKWIFLMNNLIEHRCLDAEHLLGTEYLQGMPQIQRLSVIDMVHRCGPEIRATFRAYYLWRATFALSISLLVALVVVGGLLAAASVLPAWWVGVLLIPAGAGVVFSALGFVENRRDLHCLRASLSASSET